MSTQKRVEEIHQVLKMTNRLDQLKPKKRKEPKRFDDYFQGRIKNKKIPKDTPKYLRKALERAMKEYDVGVKHEKSALENFADKYVIERNQELYH